MKGQILLILILAITVALAIGLSIVQKSLLDVSTSTKVEQSSKAFSAAEAGIEKALLPNRDITGVNFPETGAKTTLVQDTNWMPYKTSCITTPCPTQPAIEYPPLSKEQIAHVWLADLDSPSNPPAEFFDPPTSPTNKRTLDIYWGDIKSTSDNPAIQIKIVYIDAVNNYQIQPYYLDPSSIRASSTNFTPVSCSSFSTNTILDTSSPRSFYCKWTTPVLPAKLMLVRLRLLYNSVSHPIAVQPSDTTCIGCYLPPQARIIRSTGESGQTQRTVEVFQLKKVVPPYFDYAIFSAGDISK